MIRRLPDYVPTFADDDPAVYILAPSVTRPIPAGDTRRGTAWLFRKLDDAERFAGFVRERHAVQTVPVLVKLRELVGKLGERDLTFVLDPEPKVGYGDPLCFKAPLAH